MISEASAKKKFMDKKAQQDDIAEPMSSSYADGLSPYDHKGKLGLQEVNFRNH
jgi:hypothetical protein